MPSMTPLGKRWENLHSLWVLWLLVLYKDGNLSFIPFFYIGIRARKLKWILAGCGYLIVVLAFYAVKVFDYIEHPIFNLALAFMLFFYVTAWVHGLWARKEYLQIIAERELEKRRIHESQGADDARDRKVQQAIYSGKQEHQTMQIKTDYHGLIYINKAKKEEIAVLTGTDLAKEIIRVRKKHGHFNSIVDLIRHIHIKPHLMAEMNKHFIFNEQTDEQMKENRQPPKRSRGRTVDF